MTGRADSEQVVVPSLAGASALFGPGCATLNERLRGNGPPCVIEEWTSDRAIRVERAGRKLTFDGRRGRTTWSQLSNPLPGCLGDPLGLPAADDPGATRDLVGETWVLTFSGSNLCRLGGSLTLDVTQDHADWSKLTAAGLPWAAGGLEAAWADLRASLRANVLTQWEQMDEEARSSALEALRQDPDPAAAEILRTKAGAR